MERVVTLPSFTAIDLGAASGRVILGRLDDKRLHLREVYRFRNGSIRLEESLHWDVLHLWNEIKTGLQHAAAESADSVMSIGLDTWGVDFGLLAADDSLIGNPYHYRDGRIDGMLEEAFSIVPKHDIYKETGVHFMQINILY